MRMDGRWAWGPGARRRTEDEFRKSLDDMLKHETYTLEHHKRIVDVRAVVAGGAPLGLS